MKKALLIITILGMATAADAQISKGTMAIGGSAGASFTTTKYAESSTTITLGKTTSFSFGPQVGWFVIDNFMVGAGLDVNTSTFKPDDDFSGFFDKSTGTSYGIGPFARYYASNFFGEASLAVGTGKVALDDEDEKFSVFNWSIGAGYAAFLNDHVAIEPKIVYQSESQKMKDADVKDITNGIYLVIGVQVYLR
jgi:outer membrane protein